jgi:hypothetical protein
MSAVTAQPLCISCLVRAATDPNRDGLCCGANIADGSKQPFATIYTVFDLAGVR